jgi:hypothetical protein
MRPPHSEINEYSHAHDLLLILRTTQSLLSEHAPHIRDGRSIHILGLALLAVIADLERFHAPPPSVLKF